MGRSRVRYPAAALSGNDLGHGQVVHTNVPLFTKGFHVDTPFVAAMA